MVHLTHKFCLLSALLFVFAVSDTLGQVDVPYLDRAPLEYYKLNPEAYFDVITDSDGFDNFNLGVDFAEPHVSQNPQNPLEFFGAYNINNAWRTYNGHDWTASTPPFGVSVQGDPVTAYDSLGNLYYQNMFGSITGARVIRSTDNGATWGSSIIGINGIDKNWIAADQSAGSYSNYVYCVMTAGSGNGNFTRSTNFGATFTQTRVFNTQTLPGMMVAVGPNTLGGQDVPGGAVYVVTNSGSAFASTYTFYVSNDGGANFTLKSAQNFSNYVGTNVSGRNSVENMRTRPYPFIAADNSYGQYRGRLYLVYASNTPSGNGNRPDIFLRYSDDQGATWSSAKVVNDDPNTTQHHQWHPAVWTDKTTGRIFLQWMDTRDTPTRDSAYIYATYSDDGGNTFAPNQRISNQKMRINCTTCGGGGTPRYQGDYNAIYGLNNNSLAIWADFRFGQFGSYVAYFPDYAMLTSPATQTIMNDLDFKVYDVQVPAVKLYDQSVTFSATITPTPAAGTLTIDFPSGNTLTTFPGGVPMRVTASGGVTLGTYTITVTGNGPFGPPVHKRTVQLVVEPYIPVELASYSASAQLNDVIISWATATELNNRGFEIERRGEDYLFEMIGFVNGNGTTTEITQYSYTDKNLNPGKYSYRLKQIDFDGTFEYLPEIEVEVTNPLNFALGQNYPNPFNPSTKIDFHVPAQAHITLKVFDILGQEVSTLVNNVLGAGSHQVEFDASDLNSGVYFYKLAASGSNGTGFTDVKKMIITK